VDLNLEDALEHATRVRPCQGFEVGGDTFIIQPLEQGLFAAIVDVLGHGPEAHELTLEIEAFLANRGTHDVSELMINLHQHLRGSRGAAVGLCAIDAVAGQITYTGVGNTVLRRFGTADTRLVSQDGVLGQNMRTPNVQTLALEASDLILLHTDGVKTRFAADDYPGLLRDSPKDVVSTVIERFGKDYDDAACIAVRYRE
jgi:negative regulator of sigma-B (phosphoserine phosphatase)